MDLKNTFGLTVRADAAITRAELVWDSFAAAAGYKGPQRASGAAVAELLNQKLPEELTPRELCLRLCELAEAAGAENAGPLPARLSELFTRLSADRLVTAISSDANPSDRRRFLRRTADFASPGAILVLASAAALSYQRPLSDPLATLLTKLAREAAELPELIRPRADHSFRDLWRTIVDTWSELPLDGPLMTQDAVDDLRDAAASAGTVTPEPERVLQLAFETGALGTVVWRALSRMSGDAGARRVLDMLKRAPTASRSAEIIAQQYANPVRLKALLQEEPIDFAALDALLPRMGAQAADPLIDALSEADSRDTRRALLKRLIALGPAIGPAVIRRLTADQRWFVQRNMLTVLREAKCATDAVPLGKFMTHADARLRREAMQLQFSSPLERDRAICGALQDSDVAMLEVGLKAAHASMPEAAVPIIARRVVEPDFPPELRVPALQVLGRSHSVLALEALLRFAVGGTTLLGKPKLAPNSAEMRMALAGLSRAWPNDRRVSVLLAQARESKDPQVVHAVAHGRTWIAHPLLAKDLLDGGD